MQNTFISSPFLPAILSNQTEPLKNDNNLYAVIETEVTYFSRLYSLFFGSNVQVLKQPDTQAAATDPDEYSSYE